MLKTIRKLRKETPRRFLELRNACDAAIGLSIACLVLYIHF